MKWKGRGGEFIVVFFFLAEFFGSDFGPNLDDDELQLQLQLHWHLIDDIDIAIIITVRDQVGQPTASITKELSIESPLPIIAKEQPA